MLGLYCYLFKNQIPEGEVSLKNEDIAKGFYIQDPNGKLKRIKANKYYAVVCNGKAYISSESEFYPLYKKDNDFYFNGPSKTTASASNVVLASAMFGALGALLASGNVAYYLTKIDFYNGTFIKTSKL